jgi:predicted nuclease of predicted toxin-antitoxin system
MKFKVDENIPLRAVAHLRALGHDVETVLEEGLGGATDDRVWTAATNEGRFLITQDLDFSDIRRYAPGSHPGILLIRLEDRDQPRIVEFLSKWIESEPMETWAGAFIVASSRKLRIMRAAAG